MADIWRRIMAGLCLASEDIGQQKESVGQLHALSCLLCSGIQAGESAIIMNVSFPVHLRCAPKEKDTKLESDMDPFLADFRRRSVGFREAGTCGHCRPVRE